MLKQLQNSEMTTPLHQILNHLSIPLTEKLNLTSLQAVKSLVPSAIKMVLLKDSKPLSITLMNQQNKPSVLQETTHSTKEPSAEKSTSQDTPSPKVLLQLLPDLFTTFNPTSMLVPNSI